MVHLRNYFYVLRAGKEGFDSLYNRLIK